MSTMNGARKPSEEAGAARHPSEDGVLFPRDSDGRRSTTAVGRRAVAAALQPVDSAGARAAAQETAWRSDYLMHFRRLVEAGIGDADAAVTIARSGLQSLLAQLVVRSGEEEIPLGTWGASSAVPATAGVTGSGDPETELSVPFHGDRLRGDDLRRRLDAWVSAGVVEPTVAEAVGAVLDQPDWLRLEGRTVAVLGAGAEMGPLIPLLRWGARVAAVDLPRPAIWTRVLGEARKRAGRLVLPTRGGEPDPEDAGADLLTEAPTIAAWLAQVAGDDQLVVGNYVYADGATNVRVSTAVDVLSTRLVAERPDTALAFLATPTDVFAVPGDAVRQSTAVYAARSRAAKVVGRPLRTLSGGRLLRRAYVPGVDPGISDSLVPQQGPNYALAKRLQRWRATVARRDGVLVSMNVAPADPDAFGDQEPGARRCLRGSAPVRGRGVRAVDLERVDGRPAGARPAHRRRSRPGRAVAGRSARGCARRALADAVRPAEHPGPGRAGGRGSALSSAGTSSPTTVPRFPEPSVADPRWRIPSPAAGHSRVPPRGRARTDDRSGLWRSLVAHLTGGQGVAGSNPVSPTV